MDLLFGYGYMIEASEAVRDKKTRTSTSVNDAALNTTPGCDRFRPHEEI
jgi:hypothetical protein